jgi:hypothetical protein
MIDHVSIQKVFKLGMLYRTPEFSSGDSTGQLRQKLGYRMSITSAKNYQPLTASDRSEELLDHLYQKRTQFVDKTGSEKPQ